MLSLWAPQNQLPQRENQLWRNVRALGPPRGPFSPDKEVVVGDVGMEYQVRVKKVGLIEFIKQAIKNKCWYLGYCKGTRANVYELKIPFLGERRRRKTITHESGHLAINRALEGHTKEAIDSAHEVYDKKTWHGLRQSKAKKAGFIFGS